MRFTVSGCDLLFVFCSLFYFIFLLFSCPVFFLYLFKSISDFATCSWMGRPDVVTFNI